MANTLVKQYSYVSNQIMRIKELLGLTGKFSKKKLEVAYEKMGTVEKPNPEMERELKEKEGFARNILLVINEIKSFGNEKIMDYILKSTIRQQGRILIETVDTNDELIDRLTEFNPNKAAAVYNMNQMMLVSHYAVTSLGYTIACYSWDELINNFGMNWHVEKCFYYTPIASFVCVFNQRPTTTKRMIYKRSGNGLIPSNKHKKVRIKGQLRKVK